MKKIVQIAIAASLFAATTVKAQTAVDFNKTDCNGNPVHLYADLDAGKAVVLFYYMPSCGSCPPPAQKIQAMANNINTAHPGMVKAYAFPFNNTTACSYSQTWVTSNSLPLYAPMDSGATAVAAYGGFGMPTVVLVGGSNHRVMFSTLSFSTSDTTTMRDSILALISTPTGVAETASNINNVDVFPNPANNDVTISVDVKTAGALTIDIVDMIGRKVAAVSTDNSSGGVSTKHIETKNLPNGTYLVRINLNGTITNRKLNVVH